MIRPKNVESEPQKLISRDQCLAKTMKLSDGRIVSGVSVSLHCKIVGYVAKELLRRMPEWLRAALFPEGSELVVASHDVGKVSPHFQEKIHFAAGETMGVGTAELDATLGGHATITQASLTGVTPKPLPEILGRHHGASPASVGLPHDETYGGPAWQQSRMDLVTELKQTFQCNWPEEVSDIQANVLSGLTCVADWIGSGTLFEGVHLDGTPDATPWSDRIVEAVDRAGFVGFQIRSGLSFEDVFSFQPREAQADLIRAVDRSGVYVLEAPMGLGKTEAALYAAYKILEQGKATGIYFALPTQLTSEKIHDRMNSFLGKVLTENCRFRSLLLHSSAWLRDTELGEEGMPGNGWFNSSKRGLLAPFAVGTIDQALMGVMNVKHGFVRTFGLAGKVVILDEVHSYDSYTGTILNQLVRTLRELHCTVIILSATLTAERRADLLDQISNETAYPLVSASPQDVSAFYLSSTQADTAIVATRVVHADDSALEEAILRAERGEQVLWIENVVAEAQERFSVIEARAKACKAKIQCGLLHSRYQRVDRATNEEKWASCFGKQGHAQRRECGRILVGTQVLEQSLDIDADFLITRICPTDMLFQRIGRLWRHREADELRPSEARREAWILAPAVEDSRKEASVWGKTGKVYMPYVLYRSLDVWRRHEQVKLPQDIRPMLRATYAEQSETDAVLLKCKYDVTKNREKLERLARIGLATGARALPESKAATRYSETEGCEVLLLRKKTTDETGTTVMFLNGKTMKLPQNGRSIRPKECRRLAAEILQNVVLVPEYLAPATSPEQIQWIKDYVYIGKRDESPFRVALVQTDECICGIDSGSASENYDLSYNSVQGYRAQKRETNPNHPATCGENQGKP
jgi:CRISPR-associated endonuclease/helicase Cas3